MYDRRNLANPLGLMCEVAPLWTVPQLGRAWGTTHDGTWNLVRGYLQKNLLAPLELGCKLIEPPTKATYRHEPGMKIHDDLPSELAVTFSDRYRRAEVCGALGITPTRKALNIFGFTAAKAASAFHATHDLLLTEVWQVNRHRGRWVYEPEPPGGREKFEKQPDAGIFGANGKPEVFIEVCGSYRADRLADLLAFSNGSGVPLELW